MILEVSSHVRFCYITNTIIETFTWNPKIKYVHDSSRQIYYLLNNTINILSIHKEGFKLLDIIYDKEQIKYIYKATTKVPKKLIQNSTIEYNPILGEKKCTKCIHLRKLDNNLYCIFKNKNINKHSHYKCDFWIEIGGTQNLRNKKRSDKNDRNYKRVHSNNRSRKKNNISIQQIDERILSLCR